MTRFGTSYFPSHYAAIRYFAYENATRATIERKINEGLIHIGKPTLKPGQALLLIDDGLRYAIEEGDSILNKLDQILD